MDIRIIKTDAQYRKALDEVARLAGQDPALETTEGARLELLAKLVEDYEKDRFVFNQPDPIDAMICRMEEQGLRQKDIAGFLGGRNRASEVLSRNSNSDFGTDAQAGRDSRRFSTCKVGYEKIAVNSPPHPGPLPQGRGRQALPAAGR